jgi:hypothetical protein
MKDWIGQVWCKRMHRGAMWPIHGRYVCPQCLREFPVAWNGEQPGESTLRLGEASTIRSRVAMSTPLVATVHVVDSCQSPVLR